MTPKVQHLDVGMPGGEARCIALLSAKFAVTHELAGDDSFTTLTVRRGEAVVDVHRFASDPHTLLIVSERPQMNHDLARDVLEVLRAPPASDLNANHPNP